MATAILVVIRIEDERPQRCVFHATRRRDPCHDRLEEIGDAGAFLRRDGEDFLPLGADEVDDLLRSALRLRAGQVDLVEDRDDLETGVERQEEIAQRLGLDPLGGVHHENGPLARGERA